ncbi:chromosome replication/partitioning protein [Borrelia miyamotoi]|uniref:Chromosome replication/partitioning protein n=1 Tax=Borrelia miyamotoi TaxID=47466 RepID=A0A0X9JG23_9SPIR|nr:chromosome replication/partitioning protein [Borrelia miyamotoi]ALU64342.1 PF-49 type protein [Borrelia miyamotoi]AOW96273.1 permease [Borrelia miyamotoi]QTL84365.1 chromosome replication/partitioning protein [Borrelia miyamotoi]WAZ85970.1 chromosome replication/partitioning protein [Borrelia miyamotoi]WAZ91751.1 chromosome replication/partitioning protein [Borrelia miyamotoi]
MSNKNKMIIGRRVNMRGNDLGAKLSEDNRKDEYLRLKDKLKSLTVDDIYNKIETAKILSLINEKKLYIFDGYKNFYSFLSDFKIAKSQAYKYIKIAAGVERGIIDYDFVASNGIENAIRKLEDNSIVKKSRQNSIKPLRFQLKIQESYNFYKQNPKFTGFLLDELFINRKDLLRDFLNQFIKK